MMMIIISVSSSRSRMVYVELTIYSMKRCHFWALCGYNVFYFEENARKYRVGIYT